MSLWSDGYVSDVEYLPGLYLEQTPGHLLLACLVNGIAPPACGDDFRYCELGCGQGVTAAVIAAANPRARVVAMDFNPAHIARARHAAADAGLTNVEFLELSFADLAGETAIGDFDMVSAHGVWSWIAHKDRLDIAAFLARAIRPGGLAAISYNAMPGWTAMIPLQRLLLEQARLGQGRSDQRVLQGLAFVRRMQEAGSGVLGDGALLDKLLAKGGKAPGEDRAVYLAHEYLNENWQPLYHADTARLLADAKLTYAGSATLTDNFSDLQLKPAQRALLAEVPAGPQRETMKDYLSSRPFRRDVFVRGARVLPDRERDRQLAGIGLALAVPRPEARLDLDVPAGKATLPEHHYRPILDALAERPHTLADLAGLPALRDLAGAPSMVEIAGILVGTGQALPLPWGLDVAPAPAARAYNRAAVEPVVHRHAATASLAAPGSGSGVTLTTLEALVYAALADGVPAENGALLAHLDGTLPPDALTGDGARPVDGPEDLRRRVAEGVAWCLTHRLPLWRRLGIL
ncbi:class I SAM-dependent methyltransferase [uncultured Methylobacterium sp.]|jgi:SAM-dependent methyltransferase|uniref:class I SAM-dependent methyltransferase n=1 Tax=uncultured Methylobacterium sp. TaxID=157278 RepID=UPI0026282084|nr:class I SAM-dependent methyltransferase [uncultured Methylobacterium sp.]